jgi:hypothetical protein
MVAAEPAVRIGVQRRLAPIRGVTAKHERAVSDWELARYFEVI